MEMRRSRVLARLRSGEVATCVKVGLADPRVAEIAALSGFDCIWLCLEHVPSSIRDIENQIRAARAYDVDTLVRVARENGKVAGTVANLENAREMIELGYRFLSLGSDVITLGQNFTRIVDSFRAQSANNPRSNR